MNLSLNFWTLQNVANFHERESSQLVKLHENQGSLSPPRLGISAPQLWSKCSAASVGPIGDSLPRETPYRKAVEADSTSACRRVVRRHGPSEPTTADGDRRTTARPAASA
jgi:hypothetical protein